MGTFVVILVIAVVAFYGWRKFRREHDKVVAALRQAEAALDKRSPVTLEKDPETGVYRPRKKGE